MYLHQYEMPQLSLVTVFNIVMHCIADSLFKKYFYSEVYFCSGVKRCDLT
jgi:hypothetical protein